jgi:O-antigen/teichoic acid export membrane protein
LVINEDLTRRSVEGVAWTWAGTVVVAVLQVAYVAAISRLLPPEDFGLMAVATVGIRFVTYLSRLGLAPALIQRPNLVRRDISTAWWTSIGVALLAGGLTVIIAPLVSKLVRTPDAGPVLGWMSIAVVVGAVGLIPDALIRRALRFRTAAIIQIVSFVFGLAGVGLLMAMNGWGVWSLVGAYVGQAVIALTVSAFVVRSWPRFEFDRSVASSLLRFGGPVSFAGFVDFLSANVDTLAVGRFNGPAALGQYYRASLLIALPAEQASTSIIRVLLPGLSRIQNDHRRFGSAVLSAAGIQALIVSVPVAVAATSASVVVPWLLGPGWDLTAGVIPVLAIGIAAAMLTVILGVAAEARARVVLRLGLQLVSLLVTVTLVGAVVWLGPTVLGLAWAWVIGELVRLILYVAVLAPAVGISRRGLTSRYSSALLLAGCTAGPVWFAVHWFDQSVPGVVLAGMVGALLAGLLWCTPLLRKLRIDAIQVVERMRAQRGGGPADTPSPEVRSWPSDEP